MNVLELGPVDPFDLPEWWGTCQITWRAMSGLRTGHLVTGTVTDDGGHEASCDLVAVDEAYPLAVVDQEHRVLAHRAWRNGQVELAEHQGRMCVLVPGTRVDAETALEGISRLARAVGADPENWAVSLRIGRGRAGGGR